MYQNFPEYYGPNFINNCIEKMRDIYSTEYRETFREEETDLAFIYFVQRNYGDNTTLKDYLFGHKPPAYLSKAFFLHHPLYFREDQRVISKDNLLVLKDLFLDSDFASLHIPKLTIKHLESKTYYETVNKKGGLDLFEIKTETSYYNRTKIDYRLFTDAPEFLKSYRYSPIQPLHLPPLLIKPHPLYS